jgi:hypothetical protein
MLLRGGVDSSVERRLRAALGAVVVLSAACSNADATGTGTNAQVPDPYKNFTTDVTVTVDGANIVLASTGVPNHKSPYFATTDSRYQAYTGSNAAFVLNPNRILAQNIVLRIPITPTVATSAQLTPLGPIGMALNGVPIFNQYAAGRQPLTGEVNSFDQYNGHPQQSGMYHYHIEPVFITQTRGKGGLVGFLLDGYPVYGPLENGKTLVSADLDEFHGHSHATVEYPQGTYHYHVTADSPYINGTGFKGTPGTVAQ